MPTISVIMPVFNGEKYLRRAMESILGQSFADFEFIIINDGSTDATEKVVQTFSDPRIVYIKNQANLGLPATLNIAVKSARGSYVARADSDDISAVDRFQKQVEFMEAHKEIGLIGSAMRTIDENGRTRHLYRRSSNHLDIKLDSLFSVPIYHPTVFARTEVMRENPYDESFSNSEDYELLSRLLFGTTTKLANLKEALVFYRVFPHSFTQGLKRERFAASAQNSISNLEHYIALNSEEKELLTRLKQGGRLSIRDLASIISVYLRASGSFKAKEGIASLYPHMYAKLSGLILFLLKYKFKEIYHRLRRG